MTAAAEVTVLPSAPMVTFPVRTARSGRTVLMVEPNGKRAIEPDWPNRATGDTKEIFRRWDGDPYANHGYTLDGLVAIDVDTVEGHGVDGVGTWAMRSAGREMPETWRVSTPTGGEHLVFVLPPGVTLNKTNSVGGLGPGVDVKSGAGAYLVGPGSRTPDGIYTFACNAPPAQAPEWLLAELRAAGLLNEESTSTISVTPLHVVQGADWQPHGRFGEPIPVGQRHATLMPFVCSMRERRFSRAEARALLWYRFQDCEQPDGNTYTWAEAEALLEDVWQRYPSGSADAAAASASQEDALPKPGRIWTGAELQAETFPPTRFAVAEIVPEGLNLWVGAPKIGKSWLVYACVFAVAAGVQALGRYPTEQGTALYLALEDNARRLQKRLQVVGKGQAAPVTLHLATEWPNVDQGGLHRLRDYLDHHPDCRLVVIDVLARMRAEVNGRGSIYTADYRAGVALKAIADEYGIALIVNHHDRKQESDDFVEKVSGSHGLAGAADAIGIIERSRGEADARLKITGRDIAEVDKALKFNIESGGWVALDGPSQEWELENTAHRVMTFLRDNPGAGPKAVAEGIEITEQNARQTLARMAKRQQIDQRGRGRYFATPVTTVT